MKGFIFTQKKLEYSIPSNLVSEISIPPPTHSLKQLKKIREACDKGLFACGFYLDFKKASDLTL